MGCAEDLMLETLDTGQKKQDSLRHGGGGVGLRSAKDRAPHAFCGSWALTLAEVACVVGVESYEGFVGVRV